MNKEAQQYTHYVLNKSISFYKKNRLYGAKWPMGKVYPVDKTLHKELLDLNKEVADVLSTVISIAARKHFLSSRECQDVTTTVYRLFGYKFKKASWYTLPPGLRMYRKFEDVPRAGQSMEYNAYTLQLLIRCLRIKKVRNALDIKIKSRDLRK